MTLTGKIDFFDSKFIFEMDDENYPVKNFSCLYNNLEIFVIQPRGSPEMLNIGQNELSENVGVYFLNCLTLRRTKVYNDSFQSPSKNDQNLFF